MRDVQRNGKILHRRWLRLEAFLFAVVRDVQRNACRSWLSAVALVKFLFAVVRDVQRNTERDQAAAAPGFYSLSCETYSGTQPHHLSPAPRVSIRCRARRTAEPPTGLIQSTTMQTFLFAVVRDVQRNRWHRSRAFDAPSFYSLSCETYSGTIARSLAVGRRGCFYSLSCETYSGTISVISGTRLTATMRFYSLSCETYSGTLPLAASL